MLPVVAIVGRPNVGKSTLFNQLTGTRDAIVADVPGLTRDRRYGIARRHGGRFIVVDTGGLTSESEDLATRVGDQVRRALDEADRIVLLADARAGRTADDDAVADRVRRLGKPVVLAVNKTDGLDERTATLDFHALGLDARSRSRPRTGGASAPWSGPSLPRRRATRTARARTGRTRARCASRSSGGRTRASPPSSTACSARTG